MEYRGNLNSENLIELRNLHKEDDENIVIDKVDCLKNKWGVYICFCGKSFYSNKRDYLIRHLKICGALNDQIQEIRNKELSYDPVEEFISFIEDSTHDKYSFNNIYMDDEDLSSLENNILYYIHKYRCLTSRELAHLLNIEGITFYKTLTELYNNSFLNRRDYGKTYLYFQHNSDHFQKRKQIIRSLLKKAFELGLTKIKTYHILKNQNICSDIQIFNECKKEIDYDIIINLDQEKFTENFNIGQRKNLQIAIPKIKSLDQKLNLPNIIIDDAIQIYLTALKLNIMMGRSIINIAAASVYCAIRYHGIPRSIDEIIKIDKIQKNSFMKSCKILVRDVLPKMDIRIQSVTPEKFITKFSKKLNLSSECEEKSMKLVDISKKNGFNITGKDPKGIAAASIYVSSKILKVKITQKKIADLANVTEVTLRARAKELVKYSGL